MTKAEHFNHGIEMIKSDERFVASDIMADMSNWCVVHTTRYMPRKNSDGTMYISSTAMATDFNNPRSTVHVALNHVVRSHAYGSWDDAPIVVLAPYNDVVKINGNPAEIAGTDTYWSVAPDAGLRLPETGYVVQPDDNGPLFNIGERGATYKRDKYTDEEIAQIESMMDERDLEYYIMYKNGDMDLWDIEQALRGDARIRKMYDMSSDKKAFLRGLFEEVRFEMLSKCLRDAVVKKSMQKIGKQYVYDIRDGNEKSQKIADVAEKAGIPSTASNKGHATSLYMKVEEFWQYKISWLLDGYEYSDVPGILKTDTKSLYDVIMKQKGDVCVQAVIQNLVENKPIDFMRLYEDAYQAAVKEQIDLVFTSLENYTEIVKRYENGIEGMSEETRNKEIKCYKDRIVQCRDFIDKLSAQKTIADFDKNLLETLRRNCERLSASYNAWREKLVKEPGFEMLAKKLRALGSAHNIIKNGYENY